MFVALILSKNGAPAGRQSIDNRPAGAPFFIIRPFFYKHSRPSGAEISSKLKPKPRKVKRPVRSHLHGIPEAAGFRFRVLLIGVHVEEVGGADAQ